MSIVAGLAAETAWAKPKIEAVVIPDHAETSATGDWGEPVKPTTTPPPTTPPPTTPPPEASCPTGQTRICLRREGREPLSKCVDNDKAENWLKRDGVTLGYCE